MTKATLPPSRTADQFVVRLPAGMRDAIAEAAKANGRSMNAEITTRLEASLSGSAPPLETAQQNATIVALANQVARQDLITLARKLDLADASEMLEQLLALAQGGAIKDVDLSSLSKQVKSFIKFHAKSSSELQALKAEHSTAFREHALELAIADGVDHLQPLLVNAGPERASKKSP